MSVRIKREPGGSGGGNTMARSESQLRVCYVCGENGIGAVHYPLYVRPRDRGSYFPFLEQHEMPDGALGPTADGLVMACTVCYSFLEQQWNSFERSRTTHSKRLYWLKRVDNGHYIGAEMHCQSEYAAQVIGVSPEPMNNSTGHGHCSAASHQHHQQVRVQQQQHQQQSRQYQERRNSMSNEHQIELRTEPRSNTTIYNYNNASVEDDSRIVSSALLDLSKESTSQMIEPPEVARPTSASVERVPPNGALDLSMPDKNAATEVCYLCGDECSRGTLVSVFAKPIANCPFFPSLTSHSRPSRSHPMDPSGCVQACSPCHQHLLQQWDSFQKQNTPHPDRHYRLRKHGGRNSPEQSAPPGRFVCFLCAMEFAWNLRHFLYSGSNPENESAHPFLERVKPPIGAHPLSTIGQAIVCAGCYSTVNKQQQQQQVEQTQPVRAPSRKNSEVTDVVCHSCRLAFSRRHIVRLDFVPIKEPGRTFFPFPSTDDESSGVPVCTSCHASYRAQWEAYEMDRIPHPYRLYVLPARPSVGDLPRPLSRPRRISRMEETSTASSTSTHLHMNNNNQISSDVTPLRIHVPTQDDQEPVHGSHGGASLLATVSTTSDSPVSLVSVGQNNHKSFGGAVGSNVLDLSSATKGRTSDVVHRKLSCLSSSSTSPSICYICGLRIKNIRTSRTYSVHSYPVRTSSTTDDLGCHERSSPFFPFVTLHAAPPDAAPVADDGTVVTCTFCYHTLMVQWTAYENSSNEQNPWTRTYDCHDYVCFVCGVTTYRKRVKAIAVSDFPFLVEHPPPAGCLVLDGGDAVTVCLMCYDTLHDQWKDFERMKVPVELRKYNWIAAPPPPEDEEPSLSPLSTVNSSGFHANHTPKRSLNGESISVGRQLITIDDDEDDRIQSSSESSRQLDGHLYRHHNQQQQSQQRIQRHQHPWDVQPVAGMVHNSKAPPPPLLPANYVSVGGHQPSKLSSAVRHSVGSMPPLNQTTSTAASSYSSPSSVVTSNSTSRNNMGSSNSRTSSFAAALRKLAKQAVDPVSEKELSPVSPAASPPPPPATRRAPPPLVLTGDVGSMPLNSHNTTVHGFSSSSITPSSHLSYMDSRKSLEHPIVNNSPREQIKSLYEEQQQQGFDSRDGASRGSANISYLIDHRDGDVVTTKSSSSSSSIKMQGHQGDDIVNKTVGTIGGNGNGGRSSASGGLSTSYYGDRGRDDQLMVVNGLAQSPQFHHLGSQVMPGCGQSRLDVESNISSGSSFQPYRTPVDHSLPPPPPHHLVSPYETSTPYAYHSSAFLQQHLAHPSFRLDDPLYLERYGVIRPPLFPLPHASVLTHPHTLPFMPNAARYAPELLAHHLSLMSPTEHHHHLLLEQQRRMKIEEAEHQQRQRDHEIVQIQEQERKWEREKERSNDQQAALAMQREQQHQQQQHQQQERSRRSPWSQNRRSESPGRTGSIMHGTPRDLVIHKTSSSSSSLPTTAQRKSLPNHVPPSHHPTTTTSSSLVIECKPDVPNAGRQHWGSHRFLTAAALTSEPLLDGRYLSMDSKENVDHRLHHQNNDHPRKWSPVSDDQDNGRCNTVTPKYSPPRRKVFTNGYCEQQQPPPSSSSSISSHSRIIVPYSSQSVCTPNQLEQNCNDAPLWKSTVQAAKVSEIHRSTSSMTSPEDTAESFGMYITPTINRVNTVDLSSGSGFTHIDSSPLTVPSKTNECFITTPTPVKNHATQKGLIHGIDHLMSTDSSTTVNHSIKLRSKIDLEEERVRLRRYLRLQRDNSKDEGVCDLADSDEEDEDDRRSRLLTITSDQNLPLDTPPEKLTFLAQFGLTTQKRRKDLDFDCFLRRQNRLREFSFSPLDKLPIDKRSSHFDILPFLQLALMNGSVRGSSTSSKLKHSSEKINFLQMLGLCLVTKSKREELDEIQRTVWEERLRRNGYTVKRNVQLTSSEIQQPNVRDREIVEVKGTLKRKFESVSRPLLTTTTSSSNSVVNSNDDRTSKSPANQLSNCHSKGTSKRRLLNADVQQQHQRKKTTISSNGSSTPSVLNSQTQEDQCRRNDGHAIGVRSPVVIDKDFVQEFHESVLLQTSRSNKQESRQDRLADQRLPSEYSRSRDLTTSPRTVQNRGCVVVQTRWPGIEVIMEAYEGYQQEQKLEREVLLDNCSRLKICNQDLNNVAETLSKNMADLIQKKIDLDNERRQQHAAIDNLKCLIKQMR